MEVEAVCGEELNMGTTTEAPVEGCLRFLNLALMSVGSAELRAKKKSITLFLTHSRLVKRGIDKLPARSLGGILPTYNRAEPWSSGGQVESGGAIPMLY